MLAKRNTLQRSRRCRLGAAAIEYAVVLSCLLVAAIASFEMMASKVDGQFEKTAGALEDNAGNNGNHFGNGNGNGNGNG